MGIWLAMSRGRWLRQWQRITVRKLKFFQYSIILFGLGVLVSAVAMAIGADLSRSAG